MLAAIGYQDRRRGDVSFAVRTAGAFYGYRPDHQEWSASVLKAMLMVAYLDRPSVANRALDADDTSLLYPMITRSDNDAAEDIFRSVGAEAVRAVARAAGMRDFAISGGLLVIVGLGPGPFAIDNKPKGKKH